MKKRIVIIGKGIAPGISYGRAVLYKDVLSRNIDVYNIDKHKLAQEMDRINTAIDHADKDLEKISHIVSKEKSKQEGSIFKAHQLLLRDKRINQELKDELYHQKVNAEQIVRNVFTRIATRLKKVGDDVLAARHEDIEELGFRLLRILSGTEWNILDNLKMGSIIIAKRLLPADTVHIQKNRVQGFVVEEGNIHSHSAILAKSFGMAAISACSIMDKIHNGDALLVNGFNGTIIINPTKEDLKKHYLNKKGLLNNYKNVLKQSDVSVKNKAGQKIEIYANVNSLQDIKLANENGSQGIGLYRTEMLYMTSKTLPSSDELVKQFSKLFSKNKSQLVTIRLLDVGGDKTIPYLNLPEERNPLLGVRGIRFLLKNTDILRTQLEAVVELSKRHHVRCLVPMVTFSDEILAVKKIIESIKQEKGLAYRDVNVEVGAMIETPAAVLQIDKITPVADFLSIGTNDLIQYTMAASRENIDVFDYYNKGIEIVLDSIQTMLEYIKPLKKEVYICGEIASDYHWIEKLLDMGIRKISVSPYCIPELKEKIRILNK